MSAVGRRRVGLAAAILLVVAAAGAVMIAIWQTQLADAERARAAQRFDRLREVTRLLAFHTDATQPGAADVQRGVAHEALAQLDHISKEAPRDLAFMREVAAAYERVAALQSGATAPTGDAARAIGDAAASIATREQAISIREHIAKLSRNDPADMQALAEAYIAIAELYIASGAAETAVEHVQKAIPIAESLLASRPTPEVRLLCARAYGSIARALTNPDGTKPGGTRNALAYMRGALKMQQELAADFPQNVDYRRELVAAHRALGRIYSAMGERDEQLEQSRKALAAARALVAAQPENSSYRHELAVQLGQTAEAFMQLNDNAQAADHLREALAIYDALIAADGNNRSMRKERAVAQRSLGTALGAANAAEALQHFQNATDVLAQLTTKDPTNAELRRQWALTQLAKSRLEMEADDTAAAASAREGIRICEEVTRESPADVESHKTLALLLTQLGASCAKQASQPNESTPLPHWQNARDAYARALEIYDRLNNDGKLGRADAARREEIAREIGKCETALVAQTKSTPSEK